MLYPRFQLEVRFTGILNFYQLSKGLLAPFVRFTQSVGTSNFGKINESIALNFQPENSQIDCRWDRIILVSEGDSEDFLNPNFTPLKIFFDILEAYKVLSEFDEINNYVIEVCVLNEIKGERNDLVNHIKSVFFKEELDKFLLEIDDLSFNVSRNSEIDGSVETYKFGLFLDKDIEHFNLFPLSNNKLKFSGKYGKFMQASIFNNSKKFDFKIFKDKLELINSKFSYLN